VRPSTRQVAADLRRSSEISHARSRVKSSSKSSYGTRPRGRRARLPAAAQAQLLVQREHSGGGAAGGEHALAHFELEDVEGGHSPTEVPRFPADVLDREVDGECRGPIRRQLELARREGEVLGAVGGLKRVVRRRAGLQRAASRSLSSSYVAKPSGAAAGASVSGVTASVPRADRRLASRSSRSSIASRGAATSSRFQ
jgi:hypothetical protein